MIGLPATRFTKSEWFYGRGDVPIGLNVPYRARAITYLKLVGRGGRNNEDASGAGRGGGGGAEVKVFSGGRLTAPGPTVSCTIAEAEGSWGDATSVTIEGVTYEAKGGGDAPTDGTGGTGGYGGAGGVVSTSGGAGGTYPGGTGGTVAPTTSGSWTSYPGGGGGAGNAVEGGYGGVGGAGYASAPSGVGYHGAVDGEYGGGGGSSDELGAADSTPSNNGAQLTGTFESAGKAGMGSGSKEYSVNGSPVRGPADAFGMIKVTWSS